MCHWLRLSFLRRRFLLLLVESFDAKRYLVFLLVGLIAVQSLIHNLHLVFLPGVPELCPCEVIEHSRDIYQFELGYFASSLIVSVLVF